MTRDAALAGCLIALIFTGASLPSSAQTQAAKPSSGDAPYKAGVEAARKADWATVVPRMREALELEKTEEFKPASRRTLGLAGGRQYFPYLYLGEGLLKGTGDCAAALSAWDQTERIGAVKASSEKDLLKILDDGYRECEGRGFLPPLKYQQALAEAQSQYSNAEQWNQRVQEYAATDKDTFREFQAQYDRIKPLLPGVQSRLTAAKASRQEKDFKDARDLAVKVRNDLEEILVAFRARSASFAGDSRNAKTALDAAQETQREVEDLVSKIPPGVLPPTVMDDLRGAKSTIGAAQKALNDRDVAAASNKAREASANLNNVRRAIASAANSYIENTRTRVNNAEARLRSLGKEAGTRTEAAPLLNDAREKLQAARRHLESAEVASAAEAETLAATADADLRRITTMLGLAAPAAVPSDDLKHAAQFFFDGQYREAADALSDDLIAVADDRFKAPIRALRAAAWYAQSEYATTSGLRDELADRARAEIRKIREIDPAFMPDVATFSPRFRKFFRETQ